MEGAPRCATEARALKELRGLQVMISNGILKALAVGVFALGAAPAHAGFFTLVPEGPTTVTADGSVTFVAEYTVETGDENVFSATLDLSMMEDGAPATGAVATLTVDETFANPFDVPVSNTTGLPAQLIIGGSQTSGDGFGGTTQFARFTLTGTGAGGTVTLERGDLTESIGPSTFPITDTTPSTLATVVFLPEAASWMLLALGIGGLAGGSRRSS